MQLCVDVGAVADEVGNLGRQQSYRAPLPIGSRHCTMLKQPVVASPGAAANIKRAG